MSKVKLLNLLVVLALIMSFLFSGSAPTATAVPASGETDGATGPQAPLKVTSGVFPVIADFESGGVGTWFTYGDTGSSIVKNVVLTNTLSTLGVLSNTVMQVDYVSAGWGVGTGLDTVPFQDWSAYDGFDFWFYGSNNGAVFKILLTDNGGERVSTQFTDNFTGWKELTFPWQAFSHDGGYQPGGSPNDGPTLTAVEAFAFAPTSPSSGTYFMDQIKLFKNTNAVVADFEAGGVGTWFTYGDTGSSIVKNVVLTNTLSTLGVFSNTVMQVDYVSAGWGVGVGKDTIPFQDWSGADGLSFWFYGANNGVVFNLILTDNGGERVSTKFTDNFTGWKELQFPWQAFSHDGGYQPGGSPNDGPTLTAVEAFAFAPTSPSSGTYFMDQIKLFKNTNAVVADFEAGGVGTWFTYGDTGSSIVKNVVLTNTLSTLGVFSNTVMQVDYVSAGWGVGVGKDTIPFQDWSGADGLSFWFYGANNGVVFNLILTDNGGERVSTKFTDNFTGWKELQFPWQAFSHDGGYQPGGSPNDGPTLTAVEAFAFAPTSPSSGTYFMDQIKLFGAATITVAPKAGFTSASYNVSEGVGSAQIPVQLNITSTATITVNYATAGGTATANVDYTPVNGALTFAPGAAIMTVTVPITDDAAYELAETIGLSLTGASNATIGLYNPATINLVDNDAPPNVLLIDSFESGLTTGRDIFNNPIGYSTWGSTPNNVAITVTSGMTYPGGTLPNSVLKVTSNIESWGGFTDAFKDDDTWGHQDWSRYDGLRFWFYGTNSGKPIQVEIFDNRQLENTGDSAERYYQRFTDDFTGWQQVSLPFAFFQRRSDYQPGGAPADGLNLTDVSGFAFNLPSVASTTIYYVDQVELYGDLSAHPASTRVSFSAYAYGAIEGQPLTAKIVLNSAVATPVTVTYVITADTASSLDFTAPLSGTIVFAAGEVSKTITVQTVDDHKVEAREQIKIGIVNTDGAPGGYINRALLVIVDNDIPDPTMIDDFENGVPAALKSYGNVTVTTQSVLAADPLAVPGQDPQNEILSVTYDIPDGGMGGFVRKFDQPLDLSQSDGLSFWYYGSGSGRPITFTLLDNGQPDPGPTNWTLAWSDEFSGSLGAAPNPANWKYDIGGGGYGNNEWEYYTDSRDNSALDGSGNLVITAVTNTNPSYTCTAASPTGPGGPCYATSARMLSAGKQEFAYGRVEARLRIPKGQGIWPAFWMLGNDIFTTNPWPASGEIDIIENIGKTSDQTIVHGTVHGPGYSGGSGIGRSYDVSPTILADDFHVYAIEWEPTRIRWYFDNTNYFTVTDQMIPAGTDWVFDHPFFIIMNVAVGGNWPGYPDATTELPQKMTVDYVRVYQAPDTAERFETTFVDTSTGWRKIVLPYSSFTRSATQPANAPNDGLTLTQAQGYSVDLSAPATSFNRPASAGTIYFDDIKLAPYILRVAQTGNGSGTVIPAVGTYAYDSAATVWLTATANTGSAFTGWSGSVSGLTSPVSVTLSGDDVVTATFVLNTYTLTVATAGNGSGIVTPTVGTHAYLYGEVVPLTATANAGSSFVGWSGAAGGVASSTLVTMTENKIVTATFSLDCVPVSGTNFTFAPGAPKVGQPVALNGTITAGTAPITYTWTFGDSSGGSGAAITHTFPITTMIQTYTVTLTTANVCSLATPVLKSITVWPYLAYLPVITQ